MPNDAEATPLLVRLVPVYIDDKAIKYNIVANVAMEDVQLLRIPLLFEETFENEIGYGSITSLVQQTKQRIEVVGNGPGYENNFWENATFNPKVSGVIANGNSDVIDGGAITQNLVLLTDSFGFDFAEGDIISTIVVSRPSLDLDAADDPKDVDVTFLINGAIQFAGTVKEDTTEGYTGVLGSSDVPAFVPSSIVPVDVPSAWISVVVKDALSSATSPSFLKMVGTVNSTAGHIEIININVNDNYADPATLGYKVEGYESAFVYKRTVLDEDIDLFDETVDITEDAPPIESNVYALYLDMDDGKVEVGTFDSGDVLALSRLAVGLSNYADGSTIRSFSPLQILAADYNRNGQIDGGDLLGLLKQIGNPATELRWLAFDDDDVKPSDYLSAYDLESDQDLASDKDAGRLEFYSEETLTLDLQQLVLQPRDDLIVKGMPEQDPNVISVLLRGNVVGPIMYPTGSNLTAQNYSESRTYSFNATGNSFNATFKATLPSFDVGDKIVFQPSASSENLFDDIVSVVVRSDVMASSWDQGLYSVDLANFANFPTEPTILEVYPIVYPDFGTVLFLNKGDTPQAGVGNLQRIDAIIELPGYFIDDDHDLGISKVLIGGTGPEVQIVVLGIDPPPPST